MNKYHLMFIIGGGLWWGALIGLAMDSVLYGFAMGVVGFFFTLLTTAFALMLQEDNDPPPIIEYPIDFPNARWSGESDDSKDA